MKKLLLLFLLSTASLTTFAQDIDGYSVNVDRLTFGIKEGLSLASMPRTVTGSSASITTSPVVTWNSGVYLNYKWKKNFSLETGFDYAGTGGNEKNSVTTGSDILINSNTRTYLYYGEVPVNLVYSIPEGDKNSLRFALGPYLGYCFRGRTTGTLDITTSKKTTTTKLTETLNIGDGPDDIKPIDYGVDPSISYQVETGFLVNLGYNYGFRNIYNKSTADNEGITSKAYNRALTLSVGIFF
jgi:hypothetical protein